LAAAAGWGGLYLALALALPHVAEDLSGHDVAVAAARAERAAPGATIVSYRVYPQIAPWVLRHPIAVADFVGELGSDGEHPASLVWPRAEFWRRWRSGEHLLVWMKRRSLEQFEHEAVAPRALAGNRRYVLVANFAAPEDTVPR
ncbi:MAG TPA: hypothetical protein VFS44_08230, partial [Gemmatimonadaceae bacterium]|nr:hypothetical protein [Gemmatimonadaceae bacterium]